MPKVLDKFKGMIKKEVGDGFIQLKLPKHIAIVTKGKTLWAKKHNIPIEEAYQKSFSLIRSIVMNAIRLNIPIITFYLLSTNMIESEKYSIMMDQTKEFFDDIVRDFIKVNKVKISVIGKWYDLPGRVVDSIKTALDLTKDNEEFFLNLAINYDGQEEIVDAVKLIARQIKAGKLDADSIDIGLIKENTYSSYFIPPDLIIVNGPTKMTNGLLLWDSPKSQIYFTNKLWPDFDKVEFMDAIKEYQKGV